MVAPLPLHPPPPTHPPTHTHTHMHTFLNQLSPFSLIRGVGPTMMLRGHSANHHINFKAFWGRVFAPFELQPLVSETIADNENCINKSVEDNLLVSHLASFRVIDGELNLSFLKADGRARRTSDCEALKI